MESPEGGRLQHSFHACGFLRCEAQANMQRLMGMGANNLNGIFSTFSFLDSF